MATSRTAKTSSRRRRRLPRWLQHRNLIAAEALALAGVGKFELTLFVKAQPTLPNWAKIFFLIAATVGLFGALFFALERLLHSSVERTQEVVQVLPLPAPLALFHLAAWAGIVWAYALPVW